MRLNKGNLGLNMAFASHVIFFDGWWNPTTEDHRVGQTRPVIVSRLTVKDSVEDRILALQVCTSICNFFYLVSSLEYTTSSANH